MRHHLFTECRACPLQIRRLWKRVSKDCTWKHPRAPSVRWLWQEGPTKAVLEFLGGTRVDGRTAASVIGPREEEGQELEGEEGGPGLPQVVFPFVLSFVLFLCHPFIFLLSGGIGDKEIRAP